MSSIRICFLLLLFSLASNSQTIKDEIRLHDYLFGKKENETSYNPNIRPVRDSSKSITVSLVVSIKRLFELDETNHIVKLFAALATEWQDEFLVWNKTDFGSIPYTYVDYNKIWTPEIELISKHINAQTAPTDHSIHKTYENYPVKLFSSGHVEFLPTVHLTSECLYNYGRFPFDTQLCLFYFQTPYKSQVQLEMTSFYTSEYNKYDSIWSIDGIAVIDIEGKNNDTSVLQVTFKRKYKNFLFTMPSYIVYILTLLMFLLPQQSNQRITIGATCLVITTLLCSILTSSMPNSDIAAWPLLGKLYLFNIIMISFSILFSTFIVNISQNEHQKSVPDWLRKFTINFLSKVFCIQAVAYSVFNSYAFKAHDDEVVAVQDHINSQLVMSELDENLTVRDRTDLEGENLNENESSVMPTGSTGTTTATSAGRSNLTLTKLLKKTLNHMEQLRYKMQKETYKKCKNNEWLLVGILMDKIFFLIYCSVIIISTMSIFKS